MYLKIILFVMNIAATSTKKDNHNYSLCMDTAR